MYTTEQEKYHYINFKLKTLGIPGIEKMDSEQKDSLIESFFQDEAEKRSSEQSALCAADQKIQNFIDDTFSPYLDEYKLQLPTGTFELDQEGIAQSLSLPYGENKFKSDLVESHNTLQGVLHNTRHDRRTTQGVFHVAEGGLPIAQDKKRVPQKTFLALFERALNPPKADKVLPVTSNQETPSETFLSLLLKPTVVPEVPGVHPSKTMDVRFLCPGGLVSNLHFVESVFGNAGNPYLPHNDAALNVETSTGFVGLVLLAPHLNKVTKKEVGLPTWDQATALQKEQGMAWKTEDELYNDGGAFKVTFRNENGVVITIIADNYFGYCKKEVKTQISYATNMFGLTEEEHAGGALTFPSYNMGNHYRESRLICELGKYTLEEALSLLDGDYEMQPEGYAIDTRFKEIYYIPHNAEIKIETLKVEWKTGDKVQQIKLSPDITYVHPSGYKLKLEKHPTSNVWYLVGTVAEGTFCHKPATVSGGGKSEISKPITESMVYKSFYVNDLEKDLAEVQEILDRNYGVRFADSNRDQGENSRSILSVKRSLGSVIKLLSPSNDYLDSYNEWLRSIPPHIKNLVYSLKRHYKAEWGNDWKEHFSVDIHDGIQGHELKFNQEALNVRYLRVGLDSQKNWKTFRLRQDFIPAEKVQMEDDITASVVYPSSHVSGLAEGAVEKSYKFTQNCERMLFQRPDDAVFRGRDPLTELDFSGDNLLASNYEPLTRKQAQELVDDVIDFDNFTEPMKETLKKAAKIGDDEFFVSTTNPRIVNGKPTKNVRYLQMRPDLKDPFKKYLGEIGTRLSRKLHKWEPLQHPVNSVLIGRRNNPADRTTGIKALSVYNPVHYQELPELMMDLISSLSGKSPSTTGFGSEGALTKAPFNMLRLITDLNNTLVSYILTGDAVFSTAAGFIGNDVQVDHDITFLVPEVWSRLSPSERDPKYLIEHGYLEKVEDFEYEGRSIAASRLGYRITDNFAQTFLGKIFASPDAVFDEATLKPETQDLQDFAEGVEYIVKSQNTVAQSYFEDGSVTIACPPLKALLHIMVYGHFEGLKIDSPEFREQFTKEHLLASEWYQKRLEHKQAIDIRYWNAHKSEIESRLESKYMSPSIRKQYQKSLETCDRELARVQGDAYLQWLKGTIGADPFYEVA